MWTMAAFALAFRSSVSLTRPCQSSIHRSLRRAVSAVAMADEATLVPLFPFSEAPAATVEQWERIDDVVMGGVSSSRVVAGDARAEWRGIVRTDGGGFCGARTSTLEEPMDLSRFEGLYVDAALLSDEDVDRRAWKLTIRTGASRGEVVHSAEWKPRVGDSNDGPKLIPFSDFRLVRGPRLVPGAPPLNASSCKSVFGIGMTLSKFAAANADGMATVDNFRDGPFNVALYNVGAYTTREAPADIPSPQRNSVSQSKPNSSGNPIKSNGVFVGLALALLRPIGSLVFSEEARRRRQARKLLVSSGRCANSLAARLYGQRVIKRGVRGLSRTQAALSGLREATKDAVAFLLSLPLRLAFRMIFGLGRTLAKLRGQKPMPAL
eukprot:CAMPEP_0183355848 /NCGR_PEP_ID=MMETSP0164_2-20130417/42100_1 /TAXON_ID=221442 /ORGANISM="Coccolithus pelagicus ssp braarudi, Strain PLY182g" /LENGTH=378 /DNA_ID=CAMNT_0025529089 /DNA_START=14 /DNA_END=1150 /DNA_ORIENTATION=+